jgi:hypothetical protein
MTLSRRKTLALIGGGAIVAAAGGVAFEITLPLGTAFLPWQRAGQYDDPRMRALSWAILAPNSHNMQPWKVDLSVPGQAVLYPDLDRLLPETDPFNRQITISLGCFLELLRMAALQDGLRRRGRPVPRWRGSGRPRRTPRRDLPLRPRDRCARSALRRCRHRRSNKEPYDMSRPVPAEVLARIASVARHTDVGVSGGPAEVAELRALTVRAMEIEIDTPHTFAESVEVFRIGRREVDANPDGLEFHGPAFEAMRLFGLFTRGGGRPRQHRVPAGTHRDDWRPSPPPWPTSGP